MEKITPQLADAILERVDKIEEGVNKRYLDPQRRREILCQEIRNLIQNHIKQ